MPMLEDQKVAERALRYWHAAAGTGVSFELALAHYEKTQPTFLGHFGAGIRDANLSEPRLKQAMEAVAKAGKGRFPHSTAFFAALVGERTTFRYEDAKEVAKETAKQVAAVAAGGAVLYLVAAGVALAVLASQGGAWTARR